MKKHIIFFSFMAFVMAGLVSQAQEAKPGSAKKPTNSQIDTRIDNMEYWMEKAEQGIVPYNPQVKLEPAIYKGSQLMVNGLKTTNSPDIPLTTVTNVTESENSVFVDPKNADYLLNSNNSTSWNGSTVGSVYGANYFQSANSGATWGGSTGGAGGGNSGDPATAIGLNGRQYVNYISSASGQGIAYSDNGTTWSTATIAPNPGDLADKNHMWIDNKITSPYEGNLYTAWTDFGGTDDTQVKISRSVNDGVNWSTGLVISSAINAGSHNQGVNVQTGPNGEVYVAWTIYDSWPSDETAIGFTKSTNGGASYQVATRIISNIKGIRTTGVLKNHRVNSFPSMAVDISGGAYNGNIYVVWTNIGTPGTNTGTNKSVYMIRSSNGGTTWSTPIRINQGPDVAGKEAYFPWISCDPLTGVLSAIYYDDRNTTSTQCEVYAAYSTDAGNTWTDFQVSDVAFTPAPIPGLASSYMGDYLGISSLGGKVYPCWTDNRGGVYMTYVSPFELGLNAGFSASATTVCSGSSVTFISSSTGSPTSYNWSFPGGLPNSYTGQNPPAINYASSGIYDVSLTVSDGVNADTETKTGYITVKNIIAEFAANLTTVVIGNPVTFTDNSSCAPTSWAWSFPGGTPSTSNLQTPPPITYSTLGTYDVTLAVTKTGGTDTKIKTGYITVIPPEFIISNGTVNTCNGNFYDPGGASGSYSNSTDYTMVFNPGSAGNILRFVFNSFALETNPTCSYDYLKIYNGNTISAPLIGTYCGTTSPGTINANNATGALTFVFHSDASATASGWSASISCQSITVPPVADFTASTINPAINVEVTFTDITSNFPTAWNWSFSPNTVSYSGGTNNSSQNPIVKFPASGNYTVSLTATNAYGSNTKTKVNYINATNCTPCASVSNNATEEWISNVTFNTINNSSGGTTGYQDFTAISTIVKPGSVYNLSVTSASTGSWPEHCFAFIDWNLDCDFLDTGESIDLGQVTGNGTMNLNVTVPATATNGFTRMRISLKYNSNPTSCETFSYGQVEDYTLIIQNPTLAVTPANQPVTASAGSTTFDVTSNSSWTVSSDQPWCTVTPSGTGNGTITATYTQNTSTDSRVANITVLVTGITPVVVTITQAGVPCFNPTAFAGSDATICENETYTITDATIANYSTLKWTGGAGTFNNAFILNPVYTPGPSEYGTTVILTLTANPVSPCVLIASDNLNLFIQFLPQTNAGNDATILDNQNLTIAASASNYSNLLWTSAGDGNFNNPNTLNPVYYPGTQDIENTAVELSLSALPTFPCYISVSDQLELTIMRQQMLNLPEGWSGFSSFIAPINPAFDALMGPVNNDLVIAKTLTQVYWPGYGINTIGNFSAFQGYIVKMNAQANLPIVGYSTFSKTINLMEGWNILPVISDVNVSSQELILQLGNNLVIVTEIAGIGVIWPAQGVNSIPFLVSGKAYYIKVNSACSFAFPE